MTDSVGAIIVAGGASTRAGVDKIWAPLGGQPLVAHALLALQGPPVSQLVLVVAASAIVRARELVAEHALAARVCIGGATRQASVRAGLAALGPCDWVIVHDGARPLLTRDVVARGLEAARQCGAATAAVPARDTIKVVEHGYVQATPDRGRLVIVQTPQVFHYGLLVRAHADATGDETDDAVLVERLGHPVAVFAGANDNLKVTTPEDLAVAELLWHRQVAVYA